MDFSLGNTLGALLAIGARVTGLMLFAPFLGNVGIPPRIKAMMALTLTAVLYPAFSPRVGAVSMGEWPLLMGTELLVGVAIGITTNLVFEAAQMAGQIFSVQMGYSLVNILDPMTQVDTTVLSVFTQTMALLIFLSLDVHHWILRAIAHSFEYLPPGSGTPNAAFTSQVLHVGGSVLGVGIQIAAPVLTATVTSDVLLGLLGKASPQMPLIFLGPAIKGLFGLLLMAAAMHYWPDMFSRLFTNSLGLTERVLHLAR
jgi:flagellar biosynthetic protein FliR